MSIKQWSKSRTSSMNSTSADGSQLENIPFTKDRWNHLLIKWVIADYQVRSSEPMHLWSTDMNIFQSINVVECPEFWELLLYLGDGKLTDKDIPHCTKITTLILDTYKKEMEQTKEEMKRAEGRISFTTDLWSDPNLDSYMAITAHYMVHIPKGGQIKPQLDYCCGLVAFRFVEGSHTGVNLAINFFTVLDEYGITNKVSCW